MKKYILDFIFVYLQKQQIATFRCGVPQEPRKIEMNS